MAFFAHMWYNKKADAKQKNKNGGNMKKFHFNAARAKRIFTLFLCFALAAVMLASCGDMFIMNGQAPINFLIKKGSFRIR